MVVQKRVFHLQRVVVGAVRVFQRVDHTGPEKKAAAAGISVPEPRLDSCECYGILHMIPYGGTVDSGEFRAVGGEPRVSTLGTELGRLTAEGPKTPAHPLSPYSTDERAQNIIITNDLRINGRCHSFW